MRRVAITGLGPVTAIGVGVDEFLEGLRSGRSGSKKITSFDTEGFAYAQGCEVADPPTYPGFGRAASFARQAADMALQTSGITKDQLKGLPITIAVGTTDGESRDLDSISDLLRNHDSSISEELATRVNPINLAAAVADLIGAPQTDMVTIATACSAGNYAIGYGYDAIASGDAELAIVGGADALCRKTFTGFYRLGTIAPDVCRPFDEDRKGILTGEGSGMLILEPMDVALARHAEIYAEVLGYGLNCDANHPVAPDMNGVADCIEKALALANVDPENVDLVSAHGTGTAANDVTECQALMQVFGERLPRTISVKSMIGHSMGAASAIGAIASALGLHEQFIPPTINHRKTDPKCPIDCVPNKSVEAALEVVQNNGLAFGGNNAVLMLRKADRHC